MKCLQDMETNKPPKQEQHEEFLQEEKQEKEKREEKEEILEAEKKEEKEVVEIKRDDYFDIASLIDKLKKKFNIKYDFYNTTVGKFIIILRKQCGYSSLEFLIQMVHCVYLFNNNKLDRPKPYSHEDIDFYLLENSRLTHWSMTFKKAGWRIEDMEELLKILVGHFVHHQYDEL